MTARQPQIGDALVKFDGDAKPQPWARLLHLTYQTAYLMETPCVDEHGHAQWYLRTPFTLSTEQLHRKVEFEGYQALPWRGPAHWYWTEDDLQFLLAMVDPSTGEPVDKGLGTVGERRDVAMWISEQDRNWNFISPLFESTTVAEVLERNLYRAWPAKRAAELGVDTRLVARALRIYLLSLGLKGSLLPAHHRQGGGGKPKFSTVPTGRPTDHVRFDGTTGTVADKDMRQEMQDGYRKYKKPGTSVEKAYIRTLTEHRAESIEQDGTDCSVKLLPPGKLFSLAQFQRHGPRGHLSASDINAGETPEQRRHMLRTKVRTLRPHLVGLVTQIDSSPVNVRLVSAASSLVTLATAHRTEATDEELGYVWGLYIGYEQPSTCTQLLAELNAAEDKVPFCASHGISIEAGDWYSHVSEQLKQDNGEGKAENNFAAMQEMERTGAFARPYRWEDKAQQESHHNSHQVSVEHQLIGTNRGRPHERGDVDPRREAALTIRDYATEAIKHVIWRNNKERVEHLLTVEMRKAGVKPYRRDILEWCMKQGYMALGRSDVSALRARCLPTLKASLQANGVHLFDPTASRSRLVKGMVFSSEWLAASGLLSHANRRRKTLLARINPSRPRVIFVQFDETGMQELTLQTEDPLQLELTLAEWLGVQAGDRAFAAKHQFDELNEAASDLKRKDQLNAQRKREKQQELKDSPVKPNRRAGVRDMRENTRQERRATNPLYIHGPADRDQRGAMDALTPEVSQPTADAMSALRRQRNDERT
jgi:hypothetical protein